MYRRLLVPLDGSAFSERALPMAVSIARSREAQVILTRVVSVSTFPGADATDAQVQAVNEAKAYLSGIAGTLSEQGLKVEVAVPYDDPADGILLEIGLRGADLVVMCTHGRSGLGRWIYGSVAEQVLKRSPVPVLLVPPTGEVMTLQQDRARTSGCEAAAFIVPLDGSAFAEAALPHAAGLARAFGGTILLLTVMEPPMTAYTYAEVSVVPATSARLYSEAEAYVTEMAQRLRETGLAVQAVTEEGWSPDVIARHSEKPGPGLIVMATHGRTGVARLLLGSVALQVVRRSALPILLIRPAQPDEETG